MAGLIRAHGWAATPLGPIEDWPRSLRTAVRLMLATRHPAFLFWGPDLRCLYNDAYAAYLGPEKHPSILGVPGREAWAEAWHAVGPEIEGILAGDEPAWHEDRHVPVLRHGRRDDAWWTYSLSPVDDEDAPSGVGGVLAFCADTTPRMLARTSAEERHRTLFNSIDEGFCAVEVLFDAEGRPSDYRFLELNPAFERHTGLRGAVGRTARELVAGLEPHWFEIYGKVALTGEPTRFVDRAPSMGRMFDAYAFRIGAPEQRQVAILFNDVTDRERAEAALRESEERFRALVTATSYAVYSMGPDWTEMRRLEGRGFLADTAGPSAAWPDEYILPEDRPRVWEAIREAIRTKGVFELEHRVRRADGGVGWTLSRAVPLLDAAGEVREWFGAASDLTPRRRAEEAARAGEERFRAMADAAPVLIWETDESGGVVFVNGHYLDFFGVGLGEVRGMGWAGLLHPDDADGYVAAYRDAFARRRPYARECRFRRADGQWRWLRNTGRPVGESRFVGCSLDVTELQEAQSALRESEERFRTFADASPDVIYIVDAAARRMAYLSPGYERVWGEPRDAVLRDIGRWAELLHPEDRDAGLERQRALYGQAGAPTGDTEYRIVRADGSVRHIRDNAVPIRDASGRVVRIAGIARDVTDRRLAEAKLAASERRLRVLMEGIPQLVWRADAEGAWTWAGPQWTAFTGQPCEESLGDGWLRAVHPDDRAEARRVWDVARASGHMAGDWRLRRAEDGAWRWFQTRAAAARGADGDGVEWLGTSTDVDDQMEARRVLARSSEELEAMVAERTADLVAAEESLRQAQRMEAVGQLTGGIAHDFNNMLQGVAGGLEMARRRAAQGRKDEAELYLRAARDSVDRAAGLTRRLLAFARRQRLDPKPVSVDALVEGMAELVRRTVGPGVGLVLDLRDGAGAVLCDANELESALLNLCINARDAMPGGGRLRIATADVDLKSAQVAGPDGAAPGRYVELSVSDTGQGMPPEVLRRAFEPFFTTKPQGQGTGLGLSQTYGFARQSGGLVRIESEPGRGTTVRLLLPRQGPRATAAAESGGGPAGASAEAPEQAAGLGATVLLVDDEAGARGPAAERLRELGLRVLEARDGPDALRLLAEGAAPRLDLLVTDVGLPNGMNGRQVAEAVRERWPGLPVLFVTGYAGATRLPPGSEVIGKPFTLDALARRVAALLAAGRVAEAREVEPKAPERPESRPPPAPLGAERS